MAPVAFDLEQHPWNHTVDIHSGVRIRPDIILASGGYISAPVCFASFLLRPILNAPLVIHEQNVMPGLMNKAASFFAHIVMVSFSETPYFLWNNRCVNTGYPPREKIVKGGDKSAARRSLGIADNRKVFLVFGGSLGSRSINRATASIIGDIAKWDKSITLIHAAGMASGAYDAWTDTVASVREACPADALVEQQADSMQVSMSNGNLIYRLVSYLHNFSEYILAADVVISRAGTGTIAEITAMGLACLRRIDKLLLLPPSPDRP